MSFQKWVAHVGGVSACARLLGVSRHSVIAWVHRRSTPRGPMVLKIVDVGGGMLTAVGVIRDTMPRAAARKARAM